MKSDQFPAKAICKQLAKPNTGNHEGTSPSEPAVDGQVTTTTTAAATRNRPPALTFSGPSGTTTQEPVGIGRSNHPLAKSTPAVLAGVPDNMAPLLPPMCSTRSAPAGSRPAPLFPSPGRPRCVSAWSYHQQPFNPASSALANVPLMENSPLSVEVEQPRANSGGTQSDPPSSRSVSKGSATIAPHRLFASHEAVALPPHQQLHHRSISASPHCPFGGIQPNTPLLIPLGNSQFQ